MLSVPTPVIKNFPKAKRLVMYQPLADGGLNYNLIVNFPAVLKSSPFAWICIVIFE